MAPSTSTKLHRIDVTGIVWKKMDEGYRYLITKRAPHKEVMPNRWTVPGGGVETDDYINDTPTYEKEESPQWYGALEKALRREIKEEVGLTVGEMNYLLDVVFLRSDNTPEIVLSFYCAYEGGEVVLDEDSTDYAWVSANELEKYDLITGIRDEIRQVEKLLTA